MGPVEQPEEVQQSEAREETPPPYQPMEEEDDEGSDEALTYCTMCHGMKRKLKEAEARIHEMRIAKNQYNAANFQARVELVKKQRQMRRVEGELQSARDELQIT